MYFCRFPCEECRAIPVCVVPVLKNKLKESLSLPEFANTLTHSLVFRSHLNDLV